MNKVVARYVDGRMVKGMTADFVPNKDVFHVTLVDAQPWDPPVEVNLKELKALFFVKDFAGNPKHKRKNEFDPLRPPAGRKIQVRFADGEVLVGTTTGYMKGRPGFFLVPADTDGNTERCYVVAAAAREIKFIQ
jgi:hypothetical protein